MGNARGQRNPFRSQVRGRFARWFCLIVTLALAALYVRSAFHPGVALYAPFGYLGVADGLLAAGWWPKPPPDRPQLPSHVGPFSFHARQMRWWFDVAGTLSGGRCYIPIWVLLAPGVVVSILLWRPRRRPANACRACGYNLTGNVSGRCPECGAAGRDAWG